MIDNMLVDMRMALLFHYNMDLAAVMQFLGGELTSPLIETQI
jgi:hypothetical protein